jgi:hypothetical protein
VDTFAELEKRYANEPVTLSGGLSGSGVLALAGRKSQVRITTDHHVKGDPETGWFDLVLEQTNGQQIWDQTTSGMPVRHDERQLLAAGRAEWHITEACRRIENSTAS